MSLQTEFLPLELSNVKQCAADMKERGYRYVQMLAVNTENGIDLQYAYMLGADLKMFTIEGVKKGTKVPSITDIFLEAFVFENEAHDLFGVEIEGIAIDFGGKFYHVAQAEPMTVISPAQKAAREKAEKLAAAKAAKAAKADGASAADDMEEKLAGMDPEKAAKVRAAMEAKAKKEAAAAEAAKADKIANLDPEKAAKLKAAMEAKAAREAAKKEAAEASAEADQKEGE